MVGIVESIEEVFVEGMDILQAWETIKDGLELLAKRFRCEFDLASVEAWRYSVSRSALEIKARGGTSYSANLEASTDLCG